MVPDCFWPSSRYRSHLYIVGSIIVHALPHWLSVPALVNEVFFIFCVCPACHINCTASAFTDKGSYSYNSGKAPPSAALRSSVSSVFSCAPQRRIIVAWFSNPVHLSHEGCMSLLTWSLMRGAGVELLHHIQGLGHMHAPGKQGLRTQWSPPHVNYLTMSSCNPETRSC